MKALLDRLQFTSVLVCATLISLVLTGCSDDKDPVPGVAPAVTFSTPVREVESGAIITLVWEAPTARACIGSGDEFNSGWNGPLPATGHGQIVVPTTPGTYTYVLTCENGGEEASESVTIEVAAAGPLVTLAPAQQTVRSGETGTPLVWSAPGADSCIALGDDPQWTGQQLATSGSFTFDLDAAGIYTYSLSCDDEYGGIGTATAVVVVTSAGPELTLSTDPSQISVGQTATLSWTTSEDTVSCIATGDDAAWTQTTPSAQGGTFTISGLDAGGYVYTLECEDSAGVSGSVSAVLSVGSVPAPVFQYFTVNGTDPAELAWSVTGASSCLAFSDNVPAWDGDRDTEGTESVDLSEVVLEEGDSYNFTLICNGQGGQAWGAVSIVDGGDAAPTAFMSISPSRVAAGASFDLAWSSTNATSCTAGNDAEDSAWVDAQDLSGNVSLLASETAALYTYSLTCADEAGNTVSTDAVLTVGGALPSATMTINGAESASVLAGDALTIAWTSENSVYCQAQGGIPGRAWAGEQPLDSDGVVIETSGAGGHYDFTMQCGIPGGSSVIATVAADVTGDEDQCGVGTSSILLTGSDVDVPWARVVEMDVRIGGDLTDGPIGIITQGDGSEIIDADLETYTQLLIPIDLLGIGTIVVDVYSVATDTQGNIEPLPLDPGQRGGFILSNPNEILSLSLLGLDSMAPITGFDENGVPVVGDQDYTNSDGLLLTALALVNEPGAHFVSFEFDDETTQSGIYGVSYKMKGGLLAIAKLLNVYGACVTTGD